MQLKLDRIEALVPKGARSPVPSTPDRIEAVVTDGARSPVPSTLDRATPILPIAGRAVYHVALWLMVAAVVPLLWGWRATVVTSGSMAPAIDTGDIVVTSPHDGVGLGAGAVVVFSDGNGGQVAHRIVAVNADGTYVTRGDANDMDDSSPLRPDQVVGVARALIPFVGLPLVWVDKGFWNPFLWSVAILAAGLMWWRLVGQRPAHIRGGEW
jgi:signal peptidase I